MKDETKAILGGRMPENFDGAVNTPVFHASTILYPSLAAIRGTEKIPFTYGRRGTPTSLALETAMNELEGAAGTVLTPSGASAVSLAILSAVKSGDHILMVDTAYYPTRKFCDGFLHDMGVETEYYDPLIGGDIAPLIRDNTALIFMESPGSQTFEMQLRSVHGQIGFCAGPDDIYLALRGLRTMPTRLKQHQHAALHMAEWLQSLPFVRRVLYPALPDAPGHDIWRRDFNGAAGLFSFEMDPCSEDQLAAMLDNLRLFGMGYSWGGFESLIVPCEITRTATAFETDGQMLRLNIGLEHIDDLKADLRDGFERAGYKEE